LYKKSYCKESTLSYLGHTLVENRNGLISAAEATHADGYAERDAALLMLAGRKQFRSRRITVGPDKAYDSKDFVRTVREWNVTRTSPRTTTTAAARLVAPSMACWIWATPFTTQKRDLTLDYLFQYGAASADISCLFVWTR
jgi:hypothetical protein